MSKRVSVSLDSAEERILLALRSRKSPERAALLTWAASHGFDASYIRSEASIVRVLLRAGAEHLQDGVLDGGYATLAAELTAEEGAETREARSRYLNPRPPAATRE